MGKNNRCIEESGLTSAAMPSVWGFVPMVTKEQGTVWISFLVTGRGAKIDFSIFAPRPKVDCFRRGAKGCSPTG